MVQQRSTELGLRQLLYEDGGVEQPPAVLGRWRQQLRKYAHLRVRATAAAAVAVAATTAVVFFGAVATAVAVVAAVLARLLVPW